MACSIVLQVVLSFFGIQIINILCYFYGYFWDKKQYKNKKQYIILTIIMVIMTVLRLVFYLFYDGEIIYDRIILRYSFVVLGIWIFTTVALICEKHKNMTDKIANSSIWILLDTLSYLLFISHYFLMNGNFALINITSNIFILMFATIIISLFISFIIICLIDFNKIKVIFQKKKGVEAT